MLNRAGVYSTLPYAVCGVALWFFLHEAGLHATLAGAILALTICFGPSGGASPGTGLADGGRRRDLPQSLDGIPDAAGREAGLPLAPADQAEPGSRGEGP